MIKSMRSMFHKYTRDTHLQKFFISSGRGNNSHNLSLLPVDFCREFVKIKKGSIFTDAQEESLMEKIASFTVDHLRLLTGLYVSRVDAVGGSAVTTFDIRMKEPNREPALGQGALHTIEHLAATYLRNHPIWSDKIVYWGPMGCLTGNYLLMKGDLKSEDIVELMQETFRFIANFEGEVPGAAPKDCGNYLLHDLPMAKWESAKYLHEVLEHMTKDNLYYPTKE